MAKNYTLLTLSLCTLLGAGSLFGQDQFAAEFAPIRQELTSWDPVRGEWLANSLVSMSRNEQVPDRMFPEDLTPVEMLRSLPEDRKARIAGVANDRAQSNSQSQQWRRISSTVERVNCQPVMGRSYGDPHLSSFDGVTNSFQTVGEFVLVESASGNMAVHVRQKNTSDEVSVTNAIAMNVAGDRVAIYGEETPDGNRTTPLRVNGEAIYMENDSYYLSNGGVIRADGGKRLSPSGYTITWPTGETVKINGRSQMNIAVQVYPCTDQYQGILGNANGNRNDDYYPRNTTRGFGNFGGVDFGDARMNDQMQREYLAFMSKDFAMSWRITQQESLFDYGFNQSTMTFTDYSYPRVHRTINDLAQSDRDRARRECERAGIRGSELNGCIYDVGFARIGPSPRPVIADVSTGRTYEPVTTRVPNVNPGGTVPPVRKTVVPEATRSAAGIESVPGTVPLPKGENGVPSTGSVAPAGRTTTVGSEPAGKTAGATTDSPSLSAPPPQDPAVEPKPVKKPVYEPPVEEEKPKRTFGSAVKTESTPAPSREAVKSPAPVVTPSRSEPAKTSSPPKSQPSISVPSRSGSSSGSPARNAVPAPAGRRQ